MLSARRALTRARQTGTPLPEVAAYHDLHHGQFKFRFRGGETTVVAGQSGSFKSGFVLYALGQMNLPALYMSADMAQHTATARLVASLSGDSTDNVFRGLSAGAEDYYAEYLESCKLRFCFNPNPDFGDIQGEVDAWVEAWDEYPRIIVIDNLLDVVPSAGDNEFSGYKSILLDAKTLARTTGAAVIVLHHVSEEGTDSRLPAPKKKLLGKVSQTPENILSIAKEGNLFRVSVVKHRTGPDDPTGVEHITLRVAPENNTFARWVAPAPQQTYWSPSAHAVDAEGSAA